MNENIMINTPLPHGWLQDGQKLIYVHTFTSFKSALNFVNAVAELAEEHNHHPDIKISYRNVTLSLTTHDAGALTDKDYSLATIINGIPV
jgi:4a-hydroxytetrahydrobiopterin dehydratase